MRRKRLWILLGILLVVGGALYLLSSFPARAIVTSVVHTTVADFNAGTFYHTGLAQQYDGEVTLLAIGIAGNWVITDVPSLPPLWGHAMVEHDGYVYVIGGRLTGTLGLTNSVYFSRINTQTYMLEPFTTTTPLTSAYPNGVWLHAAVAADDYLYVIGGAVDTSWHPTTMVVFAPFNADGTLGDWQVASPLPEGRSMVPAVELNDYIYVIGGRNDPAGGANATDVVLYAQPSGSGEITGWLTATASFPYKPFGHMVATDGGHLYVMAGYDCAPPIPQRTVVPYVNFATPLTASGDITAWVETTVMPQAIYAGTALAFNGELVELGGLRGVGVGQPQGDAYAALLEVDGSIIEYEPGHGWYQSPALQPDRFWHAAVLDASRQYIYALGGTGGGFYPLPAEGALNRGATTGVGGQGYATRGWYLGPTIELGRDRKILNFNWTAEMPVANTTLAMQYRTQPPGGDWAPWSPPLTTTGPVGAPITTTIPFTDTMAFRFQYKALLSTRIISRTPVLHRFELVYDVPVPPDFGKTAQPPSGQAVLHGQRITYTLGFININTLSPLRGVIITDTLPAYLTYVTGSITATAGLTVTYNPAARQVRCEIAALAPLSSGQISFVTVVDNDAPIGQMLVNHARFQSYDIDYPEERYTNHTVTRLTPEVSKRADPPSGATVSPNGLIAYTITFTNTNALLPMTNVKISDTLPSIPGVEPYSCTPDCSFVGNALVWMMGTLAPSQTKQVMFTLLTNNLAVDGTTIHNVATLHSDQAAVTSNATDHTLRVPYDLQIAKSDGVRTAQAGDVLTYTIAYTNLVPSGLVTLTNVIITDDLLTPGWVTLTLGTPGWQIISPTRRIYNVGSLAAHQHGQLTLTARIASTLPPTIALGVRNQARIGDDGQHGLESNPANNQSIDSDVVQGADLVLRHPRKPGQFIQGMPVQISVEVANEGLASAITYEDLQTPGRGRWLAVELYVKPAGFTPAGPPAGPRDHSGGWCAIHVGQTTPCPSGSQRLDNLAFITSPYPLNVGQSGYVTFTHIFTQAGAYSLYLQVDIANDDPLDPTYGRVQEADEANNIVSLGVITVEQSQARLYLPIVCKNR